MCCIDTYIDHKITRSIPDLTANTVQMVWVIIDCYLLFHPPLKKKILVFKI